LAISAIQPQKAAALLTADVHHPFLHRDGKEHPLAKSNSPGDETKLAFNLKSYLETDGSGRGTARYDKDQKIFAQGAASDAVFYVQKGKVKITVLSEQGKEAVIAILGPDEFFGESCLTGQVRRLSSARAMNQSDIMRIAKHQMIKVMRNEPAFSEMFVAHVLARTIRVEEDLLDLLFNSSEKRLARTLLLLANYGQDGIPQKVVAKVSQETLANITGTTRSRVSHFMNKFRTLGFIDYDNQHLEVHSSLLSVVLTERPQIQSDIAADAEG
jgi:CRP/FNR family cyclic AMP-dependent transcriptional regulator